MDPGFPEPSALQRLPGHQHQWGAGPRQEHRGCHAGHGGHRRQAAAGHRLRVDGALLPGAPGGIPGPGPLRLLGPGHLPVPCRPLRELVHPLLGPADPPHRGVRGGGRHLGPRVVQRRLFPDRPADHPWPGREERHPHRAVRAGAHRPGQRTRRSGHRGFPDAAAPHPDDLPGLHLRRAAHGHDHRRGSRGPERHRNGGGWRHADRHLHRRLLHPPVLRSDQPVVQEEGPGTCACTGCGVRGGAAMRPLKTWSILPLALAALGCVSMAPKYRVPEPPVPQAWPEGPSYKGTPGEAAPQPAADLAWQDFFVDPRLRKVLDLALANNRDLRITALNTEKARAYYRIQRAELLPRINAVAYGNKQRLPASVSGTGQSMIVEQYAANVGISAWELDFFGRIRSLKNRALEQYLATEQARNSAQISLLGEVTNVYLALAADRESLKLAQETLVNQEASYKLIHRRFEVGASSELDSYRAQVTTETARGDVARYTRTVAMDENALRLLVGSSVPAEWLPEVLGSVTVLKDLTPGLPSEVLTRRPDILQAENQLKAANANIGAARAAFFPRISLTTNLGSMDSELSGLFKSGSYAWAFSPQIVLPIFDMGARRANLKVANTDRASFLAQYEKAPPVP